MLEKPNLTDDDILACLNEHYDIMASGVEFLTLGNDASAWVYRVSTLDSTYFLKVRKGTPSLPGLLVPHSLKNSGIQEVVAPLVTRTGRLWVETGAFSLTLYPFVVGDVGMELGLSDEQWIMFGRVLRKIHSIMLPPELAVQLEIETYTLKWLPVIEQVRKKIVVGFFADEYEIALAAFWKEKNAEIEAIISRIEELGDLLRAQAPEYALCHADIHTANILLTPEGELQIVDWDGTLLAPRERDLMFVVGTAGEALFFEGYGKTQINRLALAYYRYEWVAQEIGDYGERVFLRTDAGEETRQDAVRGFRQLFDPGDVVDMAYRTDARQTMEPESKRIGTHSFPECQA